MNKLSCRLNAVKPTAFQAQEPTRVYKRIIGCLPKRLFLPAHVIMFRNDATLSPTAVPRPTLVTYNLMYVPYFDVRPLFLNDA
jgi:hypothetical protein